MNMAYVSLLLGLVLGAASGNATAVTINVAGVPAPDPGGRMRAVIDDAVSEWRTFIGGAADHYTLSISITIDNTLPADTGGRTTTQDRIGRNGDPRPDGVPDEAVIALSADLHWTLDRPAAGSFDALAVLKHEIGHALGGWSNTYQAFARNRRSDDEGRVWYDRGGDDDIYDPAEDTLLVSEDDSHAAAGSGDVMEPALDTGQRRHPSAREGALLRDAFGYSAPEASPDPGPGPSPVPEPETYAMLLAGLGLIGLARRRRGA